MNLSEPALHTVVTDVGIHLWQTTLVILPLFILARTLRGASAGAVHLIWTLCFLKLFLPFSMIGKFMGGMALSQLSLLAPWLSPASAAPWLGPVYAFLHPGGKGRIAEPAGRVDLFTVAGSAWIVGALIIVFIWIVRDSANRRSDKGAVVTLPSRQAKKIDKVLRDCAIPRRAVRIVAARAMPSVSGVLRPVIRIPQLLIRRLDHQELRAILLHEDAHRRRFDPLRAVLHRIAVLLFFYYPLLWPIVRRLRDSGEMACDEAALNRGVAPALFARALARTLHLELEPSGSHSAADGGRVSLIHKRFLRLEEPGRYRLMWKHRIAAALCSLIVTAGILVPVLSSAMVVAAERSAEPKAIHMVKPEYPERERKEGVEGRIVLHVVVEGDGSVGEISVEEDVEGHESFAENSKIAMKQWHFAPVHEGGRPVACRVLVPFDFRLH